MQHKFDNNINIVTYCILKNLFFWLICSFNLLTPPPPKKTFE